MKTHQDIDRRSLAMARAIVGKIDADPARDGLQKARETLERWLDIHRDNGVYPALMEWQEILSRQWEEVKAILTEESENGARLRQNSPFAGVLTPRERNEIYRKFPS